MLTNSGIIKELNKRKEKEKIAFDITKHLFDKQLAFVSDSSPTKVAVCSRRSGKTTACAADLVNTALNNAHTVSLYVTLSRNNAKKIIWKEVNDLNKNYKLGGTGNLSELSMTFPNGSIIYLSGAKDSSEIEKFRGLALKLVYIDEAQSFRTYIKELIDDVLSPALMDHAGTLNLIGTPGAIPTGYFHECTVKSPNWSKYAWTFFDNPFLTTKSKLTHQQMLDRELKRRGVPISDPSIQREFFGKWTNDSNSLLVHYSQSLNDYTDLDKPRYEYVMGIDLGFDDADAIAVLAWAEHDPTTYLVEEIVVPQQGITELVKQIEDLRTRYDVSKMVIDQGGLGKKIAEELRRRYTIPVEAAEKTRKMENIALLNDALRTGKFKAKSGSKFAQDSYLVEIDKERSTPDKIKVSDRYHSDIIDAVLYSFKLSPAYAYVAPKPKLAVGSKEWCQEQETEMFEATLEGLRKEQESFNY